jgi:hypothetical protein
MLFVMVGVAVPLLVAGAGVAAFLLYQAGYGVLVWGLIPPVALIVLIVGIGVILGRAATGFGRDSDERR